MREGRREGGKKRGRERDGDRGSGRRGEWKGAAGRRGWGRQLAKDQRRGKGREERRMEAVMRPTDARCDIERDVTSRGT